MAPGACVCHFTSVKASPGVAFSELNPSEARKRQDKLAAVAALRQQLVAGDSKRMDEQCTRVLGFATGWLDQGASKGQGYHAKCYNMFQKNVNRLHAQGSPVSEATAPTMMVSPGSSTRRSLGLPTAALVPTESPSAGCVLRLRCDIGT